MDLLSSDQSVILAINVIALIASLSVLLGEALNKVSRRGAGGLMSIVLVAAAAVTLLIIGLREETVGIDTGAYAYMFREARQGLDIVLTGDVGWNSFVLAFTYVTSEVSVFLLFNAFLYVALPVIGLRKVLGANLLFFFVLTLLSPDFVQFGINGMRQGVAASLFLFALKYYEPGKKWKLYLFFALSVLVHLSLLAPVIAFVAVSSLRTVKRGFAFALIGIWLILLLFSMAGMNNWGDYISFLGERFRKYSSGDLGLQVKFLNVPVTFFRYSVVPVLIYLYFLLRGTKLDRFYSTLACVYVLCSCLYILTFSFSYSLRFAYLSEFLMPLLVVYPILTYRPVKGSSQILSVLIVMLALFKVATSV